MQTQAYEHKHGPKRLRAIAAMTTALAIVGLVGAQPAQAQLPPPAPFYRFISEAQYVAYPATDGSFEANIALNGYPDARNGGAVKPYIVQIHNSSSIPFTPRVIEETLRAGVPTSDRLIGSIAPGATTAVTVYPGGYGSKTTANTILHIDIPPLTVIEVDVWWKE